jgi:mono/diheme cytochrome c family protein
MHMATKALAISILAGTASWAADVKAGKTVYDTACKTCHGSDGTPNAAVAKMMKVEMKDLKSPEIQGLTDDEMKKVITQGKGKMMPVKSVSGASVENVIAYVKSLK